MNLKRLLISLLLIIPVAVSSADDKQLIRHGNVTIKQSDFKRFVETNVKDEKERAKVLANEKIVRDLLAQYFVTAKMAEVASARVLSAEESWYVDYSKQRAMAELQARYVANNVPPLNYSALAMEYYLANPKEFSDPEKTRVEHILINTKGRSDEEALQRAEKTLNLLREGKTPFTELAKEYSDDPSVSKNSGDLGFFERGKMVSAFEEAAFSMREAGEIRGPIKTPFGYHILRLVEYKSPLLKPFDQYKEKLVEQEVKRHKQKVIRDEYQKFGSLDGIITDQVAISELVNATDSQGSSKPVK